jgi:CRISPR-associated exonuclease Cas4
MEDVIQISKLNDFYYSPESLYLHSVYESFAETDYKDLPQTRGKLNHETIESGNFSNRKNVLQGVSVYSEKYGLVGKIDTFDISSGTLTERKTRIKQVYPGYRYQLYAEMFGLLEMGYTVNKLQLYSMEDNKTYPLNLPSPAELIEFETLISKIRAFNPLDLLRQKADHKSDISIYGELGF